MKFFRFSFQFKKALMFFSEGVLIYLSVLAGVYLRLGDLEYDLLIPKAVVTMGVCLASLYYADLYDPKIIKNIRELLIRLLQALGVASILLAFIYYLYPPLLIGRGASLISACLVLILIVSWRLLYRLFLRSSGMTENILIIGANPFAITLAEEIVENRGLGYKVVGLIDKNPGRQVGNPVKFPVIGDYNDIPSVVQNHQISQIIVSMDERRGRLPMEALLQCKMRGVQINEGVEFYERTTGKILIDKLRPSWLIFSSGFEHSRLAQLFKRLIDLFISAFSLVILFPLIMMIAVLIKLESRGPIFFKQERVGENGRVFVLYKFRSMQDDAEKETGPVWAEDMDDRMTRIGSFVRKTRIDEIPQLFNVLKGDMSIVGPRPERPFFVEQLAKKIPFYVKRHSVKPGVTGWAQVRYSYGASLEDAKEKLQYDLFYIKHMSFWLDMGVIADTFKVVLMGKGAR